MNNTNACPSFLQLAGSRYSCRRYAATPVSRDVILEILEAARLAPSACNLQPWRFIVLDTPGQLPLAADTYHREWVRTAPVLIVACADHSRSWHRRADGKDHADVDVSIAAEHICLAATALGLATCWICNFDPEALRKNLKLGEEMEPVVMLSLGYPAEGEEVPVKKRVDIQEIVRWGVE